MLEPLTHLTAKKDKTAKTQLSLHTLSLLLLLQWPVWVAVVAMVGEGVAVMYTRSRQARYGRARRGE